MKSIKMLLLCSIFFFGQATYAQENNYYLVEFEKFALPVQDLIRSFEYKSATPFMAPDIYGNDQHFGNYTGKKILIWFWSSKDGLCESMITTLNDIQATYRDDLQIISFALEEKEELIPYRKLNPTDFPIMPKGKIFGDFAYAGDLGLGRLFLIDNKGIIQKVFPRVAFESNMDESLKFVRDMVKSI